MDPARASRGGGGVVAPAEAKKAKIAPEAVAPAAENAGGEGKRAKRVPAVSASRLRWC